jgi:MFS family permease
MTADTPKSFGGARAWTAVGLLTIAGTLNIVDRLLPAVLTEPIKRELLLSDTAIGLINGFGFLLIYAILGVPIARLSDRGFYGGVVGACLLIWSGMTVLGGFVQSGWQLAATRIGVAAGEAGATPAAHAFIARNFAVAQRAAPLALFTMSVPVGMMLGLMGGGLLAEAFGWRMTMIIVGSFGAVLAPLLFLVLGARQSLPAAPATATGMLSSSLSLLKNRSFFLIVLGSACVSIQGYAAQAFGPAFLMRVHDLSVAEVGVRYGLAAGISGVLGLLLTGTVSSWLSSKDPRRLLWMLIAMVGLTIPCIVLAVQVSSSDLSIIFMALSGLLGLVYLVPVVALLQQLVAVNQRAMASAVLLFCSAMLGGIGPFATGLISDSLQPLMGDMAVGRALMIVMPIFMAATALLYAAATRTFLSDVAPQERSN